MSERALRGTRLGATSYENDNGIDLAPRQDVAYACPNGHRFEMPFSMEAEVPATWECRVCGAQALRVDGEAPVEKPGKPTRTHWDMLLERRSVADLEEVLAERLEVLRTGGIAYARAMAPSGPADLVNGSSGAVRPAGGTAAKSAPAKTPPTKKSATVKGAPASKAPATKTVSRPVKKAPTAAKIAAVKG